MSYIWLLLFESLQPLLYDVGPQEVVDLSDPRLLLEKS